MSTFSIELSPAQEARLIAVASAQGIAPETMVRRFVIERLLEASHKDRNISLSKMRSDPAQANLTPATREPELVDEGGVLVLARLGVVIDDWDALIEKQRETRMDSLLYSQDQSGQA